MCKDLEEAGVDLHGNLDKRLFQTTYNTFQIHLKHLEACKVAGRRLRSKNPLEAIW